MKETRSGRPAASFRAHLMSLATAVPSHCVHQSTVAASARLRDRCFAGTRFRCPNVRWSGATCGSPGSVTFRPPELLPVGGDVSSRSCYGNAACRLGTSITSRSIGHHGPSTIGRPATASVAPAAEARCAGTFTAGRGDLSLTTASEESLDKEQMMPIRANQATMWTLNADRKTVRLAVPPLRIVGFPKPLDVFMDFDAQSLGGDRALQGRPQGGG